MSGTRFVSTRSLARSRTRESELYGGSPNRPPAERRATINTPNGRNHASWTRRTGRKKTLTHHVDGGEEVPGSGNPRRIHGGDLRLERLHLLLGTRAADDGVPSPRHLQGQHLPQPSAHSGYHHRLGRGRRCARHGSPQSTDLPLHCPPFPSPLPSSPSLLPP